MESHPIPRFGGGSILDASTCQPIPNATVEIWHADAGGVYSGFGSGASSRTFLRGVQVAGADGKVTFKTVYPGWYQGRATHIHLKAPGERHRAHDPAVLRRGHQQRRVRQGAVLRPRREPHTERPGRHLLGRGSSAIVKVSPSDAGYMGGINLGVKR